MHCLGELHDLVQCSLETENINDGNHPISPPFFSCHPLFFDAFWQSNSQGKKKL